MKFIGLNLSRLKVLWNWSLVGWAWTLFPDICNL